MDLLADAATYLQRHTNEFDSKPTNIGINTEYENPEEYIIEGEFPEERKQQITSPKKNVPVDPNTEIHTQIQAVFNTVRSNISLRGANMDSFHLSETVEVDALLGDISYSPSEADARLFIPITSTVSLSLRKYLLSLIARTLSDRDPDLTPEHITTAEFHFSDVDTCVLQSVRGEMNTPRPHLHYQVETLEEYLQVISDESNYTDLLNQSTYETSYRLSSSTSYPCNTVQHIGETIMWHFIEESIETDYEYLVEAEGIFVGDVSDKSYGESIKYYLTIPVVENTVGKTKS